jgi:tRNA(fMet)-specific endonuclease VapC
MKYMLDTDMCIYIIKKKSHKVIESLKKLDLGDVFLSVITLAELEYGVEKSEHREKNKIALIGFLSPFEVLPFSHKAAVAYGEIRATLEKKGQIIGPYDLLIAAHALSEDIILVTNNVREFARIPNLQVENWSE